MVEATVFGHPDFAERLARLIQTEDEPAQLEILSSEFTKEDLRTIFEFLRSKTLREHTEQELRFLEILEQHVGELEVGDLLREWFRNGARDV